MAKVSARSRIYSGVEAGHVSLISLFQPESCRHEMSHGLSEIEIRDFNRMDRDKEPAWLHHKLAGGWAVTPYVNVAEPEWSRCENDINLRSQATCRL